MDFVFFNDTATTEIYTLSLHDALPISILIGTLATVLGIVLTPALVGAFGTGVEVADHAETYLAIAFLGTTPLDRKSTRLNSSHANISYAVFCLKKKQTSLTATTT